jgi:hypothetical protein
MKHPAFVKKHNMAIRPNKNWIATKVYVQPYARLQPLRSRLSFLSVFAPVLPRSYPDLAFVPNDPIDSLDRPALSRVEGRSAIHPRHMVRNGS